MLNFIHHVPTKMIFGKGAISKMSEQFDRPMKIMLTFGSGSVKKNGVYEQVLEALRGHEIVEFWGIEPNPKVQTIRKAVDFGRKEGVEYIIAVGGGSIIDATKLISPAILYEGDAWDLVLDSKKIKGYIPFASVMTMPATGSEMNNGAVISNLETNEKFGFTSTHPQFAVLDPQVTYSIPKYQIACGITDTFVHVMEQYLTQPNINPIMDRWAEAILITLIDIAPQIMENQTDYDLMSQYMFCATMGLNRYLSMGVPQDWATHQIGHELTALHGVTHGESLAIVLPGTMTVLANQKKDKILQYALRVWGIDGDEPDAIKIAIAIDKTEHFFANLGLKTRLSQHNIGQETIEEIERRFNARGVHFGECANVDGTVARTILETVL